MPRYRLTRSGRGLWLGPALLLLSNNPEGGEHLKDFLVGLNLSTVFDLPSGALIVWCTAVFAIIMGYMCRLLRDKPREAHA
jgi:hypothetical protein